jgi:hypothetical protein
VKRSGAECRSVFVGLPCGCNLIPKILRATYVCKILNIKMTKEIMLIALDNTRDHHKIKYNMVPVRDALCGQCLRIL